MRRGPGDVPPGPIACSDWKVAVDGRYTSTTRSRPTSTTRRAARAERDRTFHICSDCRVCVKLCPSFRSLFEMIDDLGGSDHAGELTDAQHKRVVDECYQCKLCYVICPYTPDQQQEWRIDFPQLMLRSLAIQAREGKASTQRPARSPAPTSRARSRPRSRRS